MCGTVQAINAKNESKSEVKFSYRNMYATYVYRILKIVRLINLFQNVFVTSTYFPSFARANKAIFNFARA